MENKFFRKGTVFFLCMFALTLWTAVNVNKITNLVNNMGNAVGTYCQPR